MEETAVIQRIMPNSVEAEQSVIGSMLMDKDAIVTAMEILVREDFYYQQYGILFETMIELYNEGQPVDPITLQNKLKEKEVPPEVASLEYVKDVLVAVPTSANIKYYADIVKGNSIKRRMIRTMENLQNICYEGKEPVEQIMDKTEKDIFSCPLHPQQPQPVPYPSGMHRKFRTDMPSFLQKV